jgi:ADP-ribose pyrophosphatase
VPNLQTPAVRAWRKLDEQSVYRGFRHILRRRFRPPCGLEADFDVLANPDTVAVLALTEQEEVVLVRQFRPGPEQLLDELPGGVVDDGEEPLAAARRELLEETGYTGELRAAGSHWAGAYSTHERHAFAATGCERVADPAPGEPGEVVLIPLPEFRRHLRRGRLTDVGAAYLALDVLNLL